MEWQRFAPLLNRFEEPWGVSYQPPASPASVSEQEQVHTGGDEESTGFDEDSGDESEEDDNEETKEDRAFIDDDDEDDLEEDDVLSFHR